MAPSSKYKQMLEKMKNGNPATKALLLFLMAPKGLIIFGPVMLKKYMPVLNISAAALLPGLAIAGRLGLGYITYMILDRWRNYMANVYC